MALSALSAENAFLRAGARRILDISILDADHRERRPAFFVSVRKDVPFRDKKRGPWVWQAPRSSIFGQMTSMSLMLISLPVTR